MERRTFVGGLPIAAGMVGVISLSAEPSSLDNEKHKAARWRLQNARAFFPKGEFVRAGDLLYQLGIESQLALTACVVADGWTDEACRRRIGLDVGKAHFFAKAGGLQLDSESLAVAVADCKSVVPVGRIRSCRRPARSVWHCIAARPDGVCLGVWLDGRGLSPPDRTGRRQSSLLC